MHRHRVFLLDQQGALKKVRTASSYKRHTTMGEKESFFMITSLYHSFQEYNMCTVWCIRKANILLFSLTFHSVLNTKEQVTHVATTRLTLDWIL